MNSLSSISFLDSEVEKQLKSLEVKINLLQINKEILFNKKLSVVKDKSLAAPLSQIAKEIFHQLSLIIHGRHKKPFSLSQYNGVRLKFEDWISESGLESCFHVNSENFKLFKRLNWILEDYDRLSASRLLRTSSIFFNRQSSEFLECFLGLRSSEPQALLQEWLVSKGYRQHQKFNLQLIKKGCSISSDFQENGSWSTEIGFYALKKIDEVLDINALSTLFQAEAFLNSISSSTLAKRLSAEKRQEKVRSFLLQLARLKKRYPQHSFAFDLLALLLQKADHMRYFQQVLNEIFQKNVQLDQANLVDFTSFHQEHSYAYLNYFRQEIPIYHRLLNAYQQYKGRDLSCDGGKKILTLAQIEQDIQVKKEWTQLLEKGMNEFNQQFPLYQQQYSIGFKKLFEHAFAHQEAIIAPRFPPNDPDSGEPSLLKLKLIHPKDFQPIAADQLYPNFKSYIAQIPSLLAKEERKEIKLAEEEKGKEIPFFDASHRQPPFKSPVNRLNTASTIGDLDHCRSQLQQLTFGKLEIKEESACQESAYREGIDTPPLQEPSLNYTLHRRVSKWFDPTYDPFRKNPKYSHIQNPHLQHKIRCFHNFAQIADPIVLTYGLETPFLSQTTGKENKQYTLPCELEVGGRTYRGVLGYCIEHKGDLQAQEIWHRCFQEKTQEGQLKEFCDKGFLEFDYPLLRKKEKESFVLPTPAAITDKSFIDYKKSSKQIVVVNDPKNQAILKIILVNNF